jgi:glycosyltransferase involved in cell wall biosynthesis
MAIAQELEHLEFTYPFSVGGSVLPRIDTSNTTFAILSFEGPDPYSNAGGLGVRVTELSHALAQNGYDTHLYFVGDPDYPRVEHHWDGRLTYHRWCGWISRFHPNGVYDGENGKLNDFRSSIPRAVVEDLIKPGIDQGKRTIVLSEDWHTASTSCEISDYLFYGGLRHHALLLWNANNTFGFHHVDFARLRFTQTVTAVSHWMKHMMWGWGCDPIVIPNGIPARLLEPSSEMDRLARDARHAFDGRAWMVKVARWDPDKRWLMALDAVAGLKRRGIPTLLLAKGGSEPHGGEVMAHAHHLGLRVRDVHTADRHCTPEEGLRALADAAHDADVLNIRFFVPEVLLRALYRSADATLANSGREPFGLVGLEVMASGGLAFTGSTGEEYARAFENAIVLETGDPNEIVSGFAHLLTQPDESLRLRAAARETAYKYTWDRVIELMVRRLQFLGLGQGWE